MNNFVKSSNSDRANITYLAIGSAFSIAGGPQQHPPFMEKMISEHPEFIFEIILVDPLMENLPEVVKYYDLNLVETNRYKKNNLIVSVIREKFLFDFIVSKSTSAYDSKNLLYLLIDRTINLKSENPTETFLLFVHDFSGYRIDKFSDMVWDEYQKKDETIKYLYKKNILIDLNNKIDGSCFVDLNSPYFYPELIINSHGTYEIFNPFMLEDFDIYTIFITAQKYDSSNIKKMIFHVIMHRLEEFSNNILPNYRQFRILRPDIISSQKQTANILSKLNSITGYLDFFLDPVREEIFGDFIDLCKNPTLENPYEIIKKFNLCQKKLEIFVLNLNPIDNYTRLNVLSINYVMTNKKLPLFMELLLQNK